jgi:hypothetical protein
MEDKVYYLLVEAASLCDDGAYRAEQVGDYETADAFRKAQAILDKAELRY